MVFGMVKCLNNDITVETLRQRIGIIRENIHTAALSGGFDPEAVRLMAVTKYVGAEAILRAIEAGITLIGENREQSLSQKLPLLPREKVQVHFIGRLQRNKAARVVRQADMVESLDSPARALECSLRSTSGEMGTRPGCRPGMPGALPKACAPFPTCSCGG